MSRYQGRFPTGLKTPARNHCGSRTKVNICWLKSCSRSAMSEVTPWNADIHTVCARTPVNTKCSRLMPAAWPNPACRPLPRTKMKMSGNEKSEMMRVRSRSSFTKSRCAMARTADASLTGVAHDLEVRVLEARHVRAHHGERRLDALQGRVRAARVHVHAERTVTVARDLELRELAPQARAVVAVDEHELLDQVGLDLVRCAERDDLAFVDDADRVGLFRLLEVVRREEDRRAALAAGRAQVFPQRPP